MGVTLGTSPTITLTAQVPVPSAAKRQSNQPTPSAVDSSLSLACSLAPRASSTSATPRPLSSSTSVHQTLRPTVDCRFDLACIPLAIIAAKAVSLQRARRSSPARRVLPLVPAPFSAHHASFPPTPALRGNQIEQSSSASNLPTRRIVLERLLFDIGPLAPLFCSSFGRLDALSHPGRTFAPLQKPIVSPGESYLFQPHLVSVAGVKLPVLDSFTRQPHFRASCRLTAPAL